MATETKQDLNNECQICYEKYTSQLRRPIECHSCFQKCCSNCVSYYLLNTSGNATCMFKNCNKPWSDNYIFETLGKNIYSKFRDYKLEQLYQKEKSLIPKTQLKIQTERELININSKVEELETNIFRLESLNRLLEQIKKYNHFSDKPIIDRKSEIEILNKLDIFYYEVQLLKNKRKHLRNDPNKDKIKFIKNCGETNCKGLLSSKWICGICKTKYCKNCGEKKGIATIFDEMQETEIDDDTNNETKNEIQETKIENETNKNHICDPALVETMKAIQKETKACPKCGINIYKIEGCSQMWCTNCHTAFDWTTRRIETGRIHNPHYYDWQRKVNNGTAPRVVGDIPPCQQVPPFFNNILKFRYLDPDMILCLEDFYRFVNEVDDIYNPANFHDIDENTFEYYRENLINNFYPNEKHYKTNLKKAFNKFEKKLETQQIFLTFKTIIVETLNNLNQAQSEKIMSELIDTIHNVVDFTNDNLYKLSQKYSTSVYDKIEYGRRERANRWFIGSVNKGPAQAGRAKSRLDGSQLENKQG